MNHKFNPAIIVHGGAGRIREEELPERLDGCKEAAMKGWEILQRNGSALDAVEVAVAVLEDNPLFNAGIGSTLNRLGQIEMDAAVMDGQTLRAGAVGAVQKIKNPVKLARLVMEDGRHILLAGEGALLFARELGIPEYVHGSPEKERQSRSDDAHGTVGAVAVDATGKVAVATSTGGILNKLPGRVGDSPLPGCGTYADEHGGASCTGHGEAIIRVLMARSAVDFLRAGLDPQSAAINAIALLEEKTHSTAGLIILDRTGRIGYARNTTHMPVCFIAHDGVPKLDS